MKSVKHQWSVIALLALGLPVTGQVPRTNEACFRCHSMATMARRGSTGEIQSLAVIPSDYSHSEHKRLNCVMCHAVGYDRFPHRPKAAAPSNGGESHITQRFQQGSNYRQHPELFSCFNCHNAPPPGLKKPAAAPGVPPLPREAYAEIAEEFQRSVHYRKHPDLFSCFSCHDPHSFKRWTDVNRQSIAEQNVVCLRCHASQENYSRIAKRQVPDLAVVHAWLPHQEVHMKQVRCLDCHSSYQPPVKSHAILPKSEAIRDCVKCHSANSVLRQKLYRRQRREETAKLGFANALIVNDAYVIGATRNRGLDLFGALILGGTALGVTGHLAARRVAARHAEGGSDDQAS